MAEYATHRFAQIYPLREGQPLWELADDIKANGLQFPIVLFAGMILDGRRRMLACVRAEVKPTFERFNGTEVQALAFVKSANHHRRHLADAERTIAAAEYLREMAALHAPSTIEAVADEFQVSPRSVSRAKRVVATGTPSLVEAARNGEMPMAVAAEVSAEVPTVQDAMVAAVTATIPTPDPPSTPIMLDQEGDVVPERANSAFEAAKAIVARCTLLDTIANAIEAAARTDGWQHVNATSICQTLRALRSTLYQSRATHLCPYCHGEGVDCPCCKGRGWTIKASWMQRPNR